MVKLLFPVLCAITGTQALWLGVCNQEWTSYANQGSAPKTRYCVVGRGENKENAIANCRKKLSFEPVSLATGYCDQLPYSKSSQGKGFWNDYGTVNYIDDNWHWYCNPLNENSGSTGWNGACDAGGGAPRKKREVKFAA